MIIKINAEGKVAEGKSRSIQMMLDALGEVFDFKIIERTFRGDQWISEESVTISVDRKPEVSK